MSGPEEARTLLGADERDLRALKGMTDTAIFDDEIVGFHAQQAAEKLLKVWLTLLSEHYPLTHNLDHLLRLVQTREPEAEQFRDLVEYNPYAVQFRYEYVASEDTAIDREEAGKRLDALRHHVVHRLAEIENQRELQSGHGRESEEFGDSPPRGLGLSRTAVRASQVPDPPYFKARAAQHHSVHFADSVCGALAPLRVDLPGRPGKFSSRRAAVPWISIPA